VIQQLNTKDHSYLNRLHQLEAPPKKLYVRGTLRTDLPLVAIIGSRRPTKEGLSTAHEFAKQLAQAGVGVVSGLALGIDTAAHRGTLKGGGYTVAVLAHGLDTVQPSSHAQVAEQIVKSGGGLISEYSTGTPALGHHFVERNRIVAALSDAILVVEATEKSGTTITANHGFKLDRTLMAVPGSIHSILSHGTHSLIKRGARLVTEVNDITSALKLEHKHDTKPLFLPQDANQVIVLSKLSESSSTTTGLLAETRLDSHELMQTLSVLEIEGAIINIGNNRWQIAPNIAFSTSL